MSDRTCSVDDCNREVSCRGYCTKHYSQWRKHGTVREPTQKLRTYPEMLPCSVKGCDHTAKSRTLCSMHYQRWKKTGTTDCDRPLKRPTSEWCSIDGCDRKVRAFGWCQTHYMRWRRYGDPEHLTRSYVLKDLKLCRKCGQDKPRTEFWRASENWDGLCTTCKSCMSATNEVWRSKNQGRVSETSARYWIANKERLAEYDKVRRAQNRDAKSASDAAWRERNAERVSWYNKLNLSRMRAQWGIEFTVEQLIQRMDYFGRKCWICGVGTSGVDHVKPIIMGGPHLLANLRPCCRSCNSRKGGVWPVTPTRLELWRAG